MAADRGDHSGASVALGFPGQGGDWSAALSVLTRHARHPLVGALAERLGTSDWAALSVADTRHAQPVVFTAGLVAAAAVDPETIVAVLGHSLGEITAATWAGALTPDAGLDLVCTRAELGHRQHADRPSSMAAINRLDAREIERLRRGVIGMDLARPGGGGTLEVAVRNSPTQFVLSGDTHLVDAAVALANQHGAVARVLPIDGAYHGPLLVPAEGAFARAVAAAVSADPRVPLVCSTRPSPVTKAEELPLALAQSLSLPVDWPAAVDATVALGARRAIDAGPGDTLRRLSRFLPQLPTDALEVATPEAQADADGAAEAGSA